MRELNYIEILEINGGATHPPIVSNDANVQGGYSVGWHLGHAIGNTVQMFGNTLSALGMAIKDWF